MGIIVVSGRVSKAVYTDDFNRSNGVVGSNWTYGNGTQPQISSNAVAMTGSTDSFYPIKYAFSVNSDNFYVQATCTGTSSVSSGLLIRVAQANWSMYTLVLLNNSASQIGTATSATGGGYTSRTTGGPSYTTNDVVRIECSGNIYTAKKNGSTTISWTDSGGITTIGSSNRTGGLTVQRSSFTNSGGFDNFSMGDL